MVLNEETELRKLPLKIRTELCQIFSIDEQWKTVMAHIPKSPSDPSTKYTNDHVNIVEKHSSVTGKLAMDVLLDEWGTSGRKRPTIRTLLNLCQQLELYRAADFLQGHCMGEKTEERSDNIKVLQEKEKVQDTVNFSSHSLPSYSKAIAKKEEEVENKLGSLMLNHREEQELLSPVSEMNDNLADLSMQTQLPHFAYSFLETITSNFDDKPVEQGGALVGSGAFGTVYKGRLTGQLGLGNQPVAVKRMNKDISKVEEQFKNEILMMSLVSNPNLVPLIAYSSDSSCLCLLYPFMEGGSLEQRLAITNAKCSPLVPMQRLRISLGISHGLAYLHTQSLVHRDIKSANILLDNKGEARIGDFGLVRLGGGGGDGGGTLLTQVAVGTSAYMAPEAVRGEISPKMDVYSFGVVLLELITGLPVLDTTREVRDLVGHVEEIMDTQDPLEHLETCLDPKFSLSEWRQVSPRQFYLVSKQCLSKKKNRPTMSEVTQLIQACFH